MAALDRHRQLRSARGRQGRLPQPVGPSARHWPPLARTCASALRRSPSPAEPSSTATTRSPSIIPIRWTTRRNRLAAGRIWAEIGSAESAWSGRVGASMLGSSNRNYLASEPLNRTSGLRRTLDAQARAPLRNGPGAAPADPGGRSRKREIPRSRPSARLADRPGPKPSAPGGHRRVDWRTRRVYRRSRGPPRLLQSLQGHDDASRRRTSQARRRLRFGRFLRRGDGPADLLRPLRDFPQ